MNSIQEQDLDRAALPLGRQQDEVLFLSELTRVFRRQFPGGERVVCKQLLGPNQAQRFHHEMRIMERLADVPGVPRLVSGSFPPCTIAMEDSGAVSLTDLVRDAPLEMGELLKLALQISTILKGVHWAGVAHKNITPSNLLVSGARRTLTLIDFSLATTLAQDKLSFVHHRDIAGTLAYLAPEQTGRTGRAVDERADLYAMGATLYQLCTGQLPFEAADPLQLIHDILVTPPVLPAELNPAVPPGFSLIILRLLEKEPDRRYQSAEGVMHDLARLHQALERCESGLFPLGEHDFPIRLSPPSRMVGRETEIAALKAAFERVIEGSGTGVLVVGAPGVGKTALINELRPLVTARRGWFVSGKFDQLRQDPSSSGNVQALRALGRLLLAEPEAELKQHRERLLRELGGDAGLITAALPEFSILLGVPPGAMPDDPAEAQARLFSAGVALLRSVASSQRPVVMFIDDLQWAAPNSVIFIDTILTCNLPGLLLVGAYREAGTHPEAPFGGGRRQ
jgi:hypothetical protein